MLNNSRVAVLIRELIKEIPSLNNNKKELREAIIILNKLNYELEPWLEFKRKLRNKIDKLIKKETNKIVWKKYFKILFLVVSFCFLFFWLYYFLWNINIVKNEDNEIIDNWEVFRIESKELEIESISIKELDDLEKDIFVEELSIDNSMFFKYCEKNWWEIEKEENKNICKKWEQECSEKLFNDLKCKIK